MMPGWIRTIFELLLRCYPAAFRQEYERLLRADVARLWRDRRGDGGFALAVLGLSLVASTLTTAAGEHLNILGQDLRTARRSLLRAPAFTLGTVLTLALGIGVTTAMFSIVRAVLLKPLPFSNPGEIVELVGTKPLEGINAYNLSIPDFLSWQERATSFSALAVMDNGSRVLTGDDVDAAHVLQMAVSPAFWTILDVQPLMGRTFDRTDDEAGNRVAVISESLSRRRYVERSPIGRSISVNGLAHTIIGVIPDDMGFTRDVELWLPWRPAANPTRGDRQIEAVARLKPGVTVEQASSELASIAAALAREFPATNEGYNARARPLLERVVSPTVERALTTLLMASGLLLLVACANVANLVITRATSRGPEMSLRRALGAGSARLVRQLATESFVIAAIGGATGILVAAAVIQLAQSAASASLPRAWELSLDLQTLSVAGLVTAATAVIFALVPVWRTSRSDSAHGLHASGRVAGDRSHTRVRQVFVVAQVCLATVLVTGAVLLATTLFQLLHVEPGFRSGQLLLSNFTLPTVTYSGRDLRNAFYHRLLEAVSAEPGVEAAALVNRPPVEPDGGTGMEIAASPPVNGVLQGQRAHFRVATSNYFDALGIPLVRGRLFDSLQPETSGSALPIMVSKSLSDRLWPNGADPVGRQVWLANGQARTVIGVVGDVYQGRLNESVTPTMYWPTSRMVMGTMTLVVRTSGNPGSIVAGVRRAVSDLDRDLPLFDVRTMDAQLAETTLPNRLNAWILGAFAALALALGLVGVASVIADSVASRRPELAIRMALGASAARVVREVAGEGVRLCVYGLATGVIGAWALGRSMSALLFGVRGDDPIVVGGIAAALMTVAVLACLIPALRAARVDPATTLRGN